jgi:hypothetical protein
MHLPVGQLGYVVPLLTAVAVAAVIRMKRALMKKKRDSPIICRTSGCRSQRITKKEREAVAVVMRRAAVVAGWVSRRLQPP